MPFVYLLLLAAVAVGTRAGIQHLYPRADNDKAWIFCIVVAVVTSFVVWRIIRRVWPMPLVANAPERRHQGTSPYDGGVVIGGGLAAGAGLAGEDAARSSLWGGFSVDTSGDFGGDSGGDGGGGGGGK